MRNRGRGRRGGRLLESTSGSLEIAASPLLRYTSGPTWQFSDAGTTPVTDAGTVQQWNNRGTATANLAQGAAGSRPSANFISGRWWTTGDGTDDLMAVQLGSPVALTAYESFVVFNLLTDVDADHLTNLRLASDGNPIAATGFINTSTWRSRVRNTAGTLADTASLGAVSVGTPLLLRMRWDGTTSYAQLTGGSEVTIASSGARSIDLIFLLSAWSGVGLGGSNFINARVGEYLFYNRDLTAGERASTIASLIASWGL